MEGWNRIIMKEFLITVLIVRIAAVGSIFIVASVFASIASPPPYELIYKTDATTELTGSISLECHDTLAAEELPVDGVVFFLNRSSPADPGIQERVDHWRRASKSNYGLPTYT